MTSKNKPKFYVVWKGKQPGIYDSWIACAAQVNGFSGAEYKAFETRAAAEAAFGGKYADYAASTSKGSRPAPAPLQVDPKRLLEVGQPILESWSVDAACNPVPGKLEFRGVDTKTREVKFAFGPFEDGTNNIGEFLAIFHALIECHRLGLKHPIYSDSKNAISWIKQKKCNTQLKRTRFNEPLFEMIAWAEGWLERGNYPNKVLKWETDVWGENPADYGRK